FHRSWACTSPQLNLPLRHDEPAEGALVPRRELQQADAAAGDVHQIAGHLQGHDPLVYLDGELQSPHVEAWADDAYALPAVWISALLNVHLPGRGGVFRLEQRQLDVH